MAKKEKKITLEQQIKQLSKELVEELKHWQYLREHGFDWKMRKGVRVETILRMRKLKQLGTGG